MFGTPFARACISLFVIRKALVASRGSDWVAKVAPQTSCVRLSLSNALDHRYWVSELADSYFGDANLDGQFHSSDFTQVFLAGEYEDAIDDNSGWAEGDWDGDGDFTTGDFVIAFLDGGYEQGPRRLAGVVPEPHSAWLLVIGALFLAARTRV